MIRSENEIISKWKTSDLPLVSILCFTYNHEKYIAETMAGFIEQITDFQVEIIVHDDASTDDTAKIVKSFQNRYPKIFKLIIQKENQVTLGKNNLPSIISTFCKGKYVAMCEGDDYWCDSGKLQKQVDFLENNPEYTICCHLFKTFDQEKNEYGTVVNEKEIPKGSLGIEVYHWNNFKYWFTKTLTVVFRNNFLDIESVFAMYKYPRDTHLFFHFLQKGKGYCLNYVGGVYRLHACGMHSKISILARVKINYHIFKELFEKNNLPLLKKKYIESYRSYIEKTFLLSGDTLNRRILWKDIFKLFLLSPVQCVILFLRVIAIPVFKPQK